MKDTTRNWLLYTFGIFMIAPLTLIVLFGFGTMLASVANPSALGPGIMVAFVLVLMIGISFFRRSFRKDDI